MVPWDRNEGIGDTVVVSLRMPVSDATLDGWVDREDLRAFTVAWNTQDLRFDIGPAVGTAPNLQSQPDGRVDFEDVAVFILMPLIVLCRTWDGQGVMRMSEQTVLKLNSAPPLPETSALHLPFPNPFNPQTVIRYDLPEPGDVRLTIYDILGRVVRRLVEGKREGGYHRVTWDGRDDAGHPVASGVYLCRIVAGEYTSVRKMVLVR